MLWMNDRQVIFSTTFLLQQDGEVIVNVPPLYSMQIRFRTLGSNPGLAQVAEGFAAGHSGQSYYAMEAEYLTDNSSRTSALFPFLVYDNKPVNCQICRQGTDGGMLVHFFVFAFEEGRLTQIS